MTAHPSNPPPCCFLTLVGAFAFSIALGSDSLRRTFHICREKETFICALVGNLNSFQPKQFNDFCLKEAPVTFFFSTSTFLFSVFFVVA